MTICEHCGWPWMRRLRVGPTGRAGFMVLVDECLLCGHQNAINESNPMRLNWLRRFNARTHAS